MKYDQMSVFESIVAKQHVRIEIDVPGEGGRGWRRSASSIELDSQQDLGEAWRRDLQAGTAYMLQETLVKSNDAHMDAKVVRDSLKWNAPWFGTATGPYVFSPRQVWPCVHPYGTGSLHAEPGSGGMQRYTRNRATNIESFFRRSHVKPDQCGPMLPLNPTPPLSPATARLLEKTGTICGRSGSWTSG